MEAQVSEGGLQPWKPRCLKAALWPTAMEAQVSEGGLQPWKPRCLKAALWPTAMEAQVSEGGPVAYSHGSPGV
ncbi:hypothetical protein ACOMHN_032085 [Nucella lapillus]